nr:nickel insertion protein [Sinorhizobium psoraleae]
MHIHLDAVGGIAGDMFVAAMLDAWPEFAGLVQENLLLAGLEADVRAEVLTHDDGVLTGRRFDVTKVGLKPSGAAGDHHSDHHQPHHHHDHAHAHDHHHVFSHDHAHHDGDDHHDHHHTHWRELRAMLEESRLPESVKRLAIGIFQELAEAEAAVHGKKPIMWRFTRSAIGTPSPTSLRRLR